MATSLQVRKVETQQDFRVFFEFPWTVYKDDPNWVPPLLSTRRELLDKARNPAWTYMEGDYFIAWRGAQPVGTIAAFINHRHEEYHHERVGWFGAFEVLDDAEAAAVLLKTAEDWVRARGYPVLRGPQTFTTHEQIALLVDNFARPVVEMPYHPPYYAAMIEAAGLTQVMDFYSFYLNKHEAAESGLFARLSRIAQSIMKRNKITIRAADPKRLKSEVALIRELYENAWEKNWGFVPLTDREMDAFVATLSLLIDPRMLFFAYIEGDLAGFIIAVPDMNQVIQRAYPRPGVPEVVTLAQILWYWKVRRIIDAVRVPLMGVKEHYRNKGVDAVMYSHILNAIVECGYTHSDSGWILAINENMVSIAKNFGSRIYKTYRQYEKSL